MKEQDNNRRSIGGFTPRDGRGIIGLIVVAAAAFILGGILFGGSEGPGVNDGTGQDQTAAVSDRVLWTCSMHPQIKLPKPGKCPICFMDLIPLDTGSGDEIGPRQLRLSETAKQLAQIQTTPATRAFVEVEIRMVGKIAYDETKIAYITAWVPGRLDRLFADFTGVTVKKGDHLVDMYSPELLAAQEELIQADMAVKALKGTASQVLKATAEATLEATRDKLRLWGLTPTQIRDIEARHERSDHLTIYAPIGGVVVHKDAKEGMYVQTGTRIYTIADLDRLWVMFEAYESDLAWLRFGQRVEFTATSFPGDRFEATISFIDPLVDPKTRTVRVRAVVDNTDKKLKPDMFVRGIVKSRIFGQGHIIDEYLAQKWICPMHPEIVADGPGQCDVCGMNLVSAASLGFVGVEPDAGEAPLLIPASAPLITGKRAVAYVAIPNETGPLFEGREIVLGPRAGDFYVVKSGIEEGELVVTNGAFKIDSELQLQAKPSMMAPTGGGALEVHAHRDNDPGAHSAADDAKSRKPAAGPEEAAAVTSVYRSYFDVQMALAKDDLDGAKRAGKKLTLAIEGVDMSVFSRSGHDHWMGLSKTLASQATRVSEASDIKIARDGFFYLSEAVIELQRGFGHTGEDNYYLTHCPMARRGDGAYWLQTTDVVWNSFYGESMQHCGSVKNTLPPTPGGKP